MISITRQDYQSSEDSGNLKLNLFCRHCAGRGGARAGITPGRGNISGQPWERLSPAAFTPWRQRGGVRFKPSLAKFGCSPEILPRRTPAKGLAGINCARVKTRS